MDDSEQDFVDLCSKLLKRVRKKPGEPRQLRKEERQPSSQTSDGDKRKKNQKGDGDSRSKCARTQPVLTVAEAEQDVVCGRPAYDSVDTGRAERGLSVKDKVLQRMQQFKRASPEKIVHVHKNPTRNDKNNYVPLAPLVQRQDRPDPVGSDCHLEAEDSDEALALRLQQELDREAAQAETINLEDGGLFFCHLCHRDLTRMTPEGRTQHVNRCLDESEESAPALLPPPPPAPGVPDCPICGKKFKSQKSRSAHLKRCSSDMGVAPAVLLQALQRQAEETQNVPTASRLTESGGTKRKGPSKPGLPAKKKPRRKAESLDNDTMVALALSSSLLEQERESERVLEMETGASHASMAPLSRWRPEAGKGRGKKKKGAIPRPPPLLLVQDAGAALMRLQERVSALLLHSRSPSPPTPTRCPSSLSGWGGAAPLWEKSSLLDGVATHPSDFYTPELCEFITPWESAKTYAASSSSTNKSESPVQPACAGNSVTGARASILPSSVTAASSPGAEPLPLGSQALRDLMELAEDGRTLTQCGFTATHCDRDMSVCQISTLHQSGFIQEESQEQADLLPETRCTRSDHTRRPTSRVTDQLGAEAAQGGHRSVAMVRLAANLGSMVNNPQLSDVQLQVDSGEVYFAHSFMVYARCPLLAEMVHESGFGVQEEGVPAAQRVLMSDVPGQAVFALLQYLYTADCSIPASLRPHVLELASRFDLKQLEQLCEHHEDAVSQGDMGDQEENVNSQTDQAFIELLRSMWNEEDEDNEATGTDEGQDEEKAVDEGCQAADLAAGDGEICEENVNEQELEEIYEFAATQRKKEEEKESMEEEEEEDKDAEVFTKLGETKRRSTGFSVKNLQTNPVRELDPSLDRSYNRLFSDSWGAYEEGDPSSVPSTSGQSKTHSPQSQKQHSPHKSSSKLSHRAFLQSSADNLYLCPPPSTSNLPVPGQSPSPDLDSAVDLDAPKDALLLKPESEGPRSICAPLSPDSPQLKKEPELIVLSDSSSEMEVVLSSRSPSPQSPHAVEDPQSYTQIRPQQVPKPSEPALEDKKSSNVQFSPDHSAQSCPGCSPEVSWLIPSTPLQRGGSTSSSSTQTRSSICRTQLFPKHDSSSLVLSSPALPLNSKLQPLSSSTRTEKQDGVLKIKLEGTAPYSSTPLHNELHQPPAPLVTSPLLSSFDKQRSASQGRQRTPSDSLERTELGSFHLSPLSDPLDPPSISSHRAHQSSQRGSDSPRQSRQSEFSIHESAGTELIRKGVKDEEAATESKNEDLCHEGQQREPTAETGVTDSSFQPSFMDEPPIAFNDSWGLDVCPDANPGCFSLLRLEDSVGPSQQERSLGQEQETAKSSSSTDCRSSPPMHSDRFSSSHGAMSSPPEATTRTAPEVSNTLLDSKIWDSWDEDEGDEALPVSQRVKPSALLKTPALSHSKMRRTLVPITPMPHFSDMDTPELKGKLNRFGVRPLPKRQMILKLKEIHQYTHQLVNSDSEDEAPSAGQMKPPAGGSEAAASGPLSCDQAVKLKEPGAPAATSPLKHGRDEEAEPLPSSQGSNTSSTASQESDRSNPERCLSSDGHSDSNGGVSASQTAAGLQDRLRAVRSFILSDSELYTQILQYQPVVLSQLQERLKAAGIRLGNAKLVDYLDSQCITFTTAEPGQSAGRGRGRKTAKKPKAAGENGARRKRGVTATL